MNEVKTKTVRVFVGGGKSYRTAAPAYRKAVWAVIRDIHCTCDIDVEEGDGAVWNTCRFHANAGYYGQRVVSRLARLWMRRDKVTPGQYRLACKHMVDDWGHVPLPFDSTPHERPSKEWRFVNQVSALRELARRHSEEYQALMAATKVEEGLKR